jgi:serine/threonine protein kinase
MGHSGSTPEDHDAILGPGTRLGKYEVVRLLGAGGMGAVYEASHTEIGKRVAIKVLSPAIVAVPGARARFLREAQLTSRVRHPNIVDVTDMGSDGGQTYLVMEFLNGEDLSQRVTRMGPLEPSDLADIMLPVCSAVIEAHAAGITHRDLKPQNIFLAVGPHKTQPKVLDFGISKGNDVVGPGSLTGTGAMIGTPFYLAPEQIMDTRAAGPQSDQYALGVIMYECLTGERPFQAESLFVIFQAIVDGRPTLPRERRPDIPVALEAIVLRAMNVDPKSRFDSIAGLARAILPFATARVRSIWGESFGVEPKEGASSTETSAATAVTTARGMGPGTPGPVPLQPPLGIRTPPVLVDSIESRESPAKGAAEIVSPRRNVVVGASTDDNDHVADHARTFDFTFGGSVKRKRVAIIVGIVAAVGLSLMIMLLRGSAPLPVPATAVIAPPLTTPAVAPAAASPVAEAKAIEAAPAPVEVKVPAAASENSPAPRPQPAAPVPAHVSAPAHVDSTEPSPDQQTVPVVRPKKIVRPIVKEPDTETEAPRPPRPRPIIPPRNMNPNGAPVID